jgi:hypothetical protein
VTPGDEICSSEILRIAEEWAEIAENGFLLNDVALSAISAFLASALSAVPLLWYFTSQFQFFIRYCRRNFGLTRETSSPHWLSGLLPLWCTPHVT